MIDNTTIKVDKKAKTEQKLFPIGTRLVESIWSYRYVLKDNLYQWVPEEEWEENVGKIDGYRPSYLVIPDGEEAQIVKVDVERCSL